MQVKAAAVTRRVHRALFKSSISGQPLGLIKIIDQFSDAEAAVAYRILNESVTMGLVDKVGQGYLLAEHDEDTFCGVHYQSRCEFMARQSSKPKVKHSGYGIPPAQRAYDDRHPVEVSA